MDLRQQLNSPGNDDAALRPPDLASYIGQDKIRKNLEVFLQAARSRGQHLDHVLLTGPPGLGKTTLAQILAHEMGARLRTTSAPAIEKRGDLAALLADLSEGDLLFIDEIHRLSTAVAEILYPAMEDFKLDIPIGEGSDVRMVRLDLARFTLVGATTRAGLLAAPLRDRFQIACRLEYYPPEQLASIVTRSAGLLGVGVSTDGATEIARRSRGTPRIANRLLRRVRDFADVAGAASIDRAVADHALGRLEVDAAGLDAMDRAVLLALIDKFAGGPAGLETLSASVGEEKGTLEEVIEPFLLQQGFLQRTPRGRCATMAAYAHLDRPVPPGMQGALQFAPPSAS